MRVVTTPYAWNPSNLIFICARSNTVGDPPPLNNIAGAKEEIAFIGRCDEDSPPAAAAAITFCVRNEQAGAETALAATAATGVRGIILTTRCSKNYHTKLG
jgi:hypothetical protein